MKGVKSPRKKQFFFGKFCKDPEVIQQGSGGYTTRIRRLYYKDQEFLQQGSGGYTPRIRRLCFSMQWLSLSRKLFLIEGVKSPRIKSFFWYWCYYLLRSRDALSPACCIFVITSWCKKNIQIFSVSHIVFLRCIKAKNRVQKRKEKRSNTVFINFQVTWNRTFFRPVFFGQAYWEPLVLQPMLLQALVSTIFL